MLNLAPEDSETKARLAAFLQKLEELGWTEGRNLKIDYRRGMGNLETQTLIEGAATSLAGATCASNFQIRLASTAAWEFGEMRHRTITAARRRRSDLN